MRTPGLFLVLVPAFALAQTETVTQAGGPPRDVALPPTSASFVDEATAAIVNPAGLTFVGAPQLFYVHEQNSARDLVGNGLYLGTTLFRSLGAGVSFEWLSGGGAPFYRKTTWALSLGSPAFSLGGGWSLYSSGNEALRRLSAFDVGLTARPSDFLSLALVAHDVNAPRSGDFFLPRTFQAAVGARPFGDGTTLALDWQVDPEAVGDSRLTLTLQQRLVRGLALGAGVSRGFGLDSELSGQLGLTVDTRFLGATYAPGASIAGMDQIFAVRASAQPYPGVTVGGGTVAVVDLASQLTSGGGGVLALLGLGAGVDPFLRTLRYLEEAERDPTLNGVVLKLEGLPDVGLGRAMELRDAVQRLRAKGKKVFALLLRADDATYLVASAADQVLAVPEATLAINGLAASTMLLGGTMEAIGVKWDVARQGVFKTAPEQLTRTDASPAQRETLNALLDDQSRSLETSLAESRNLTVEKVRAAFAHGLLTPARAKELGLVDDIVTTETLERRIREQVPGARFSTTYDPFAERRLRWGAPRRIAIVPVIGDITGGRSQNDPLGFAQTAGAESVVAALERAAEDPGVEAIVVRVDSPGGDGLASDLIYRAVLDAKKRKPVVASMGDVAASGGYYVSMGADEIFALPTTVTGSIGVFLLKPALEGLGKKLKVNRETFSRAPLATMLDAWEPWDAKAKAAAQTWIDAFYDDFISEVARSRKLEKARVDEVARGRVWSGLDAKERGLVDTLGGLAQAVAAARTRAGIPEDEPVELSVFETGPGGVLAGLGAAQLAGALLPETRDSIPEPLRQLARELGLSALHLAEPGVKAMLPFRLEVR